MRMLLLLRSMPIEAYMVTRRPATILAQLYRPCSLSAPLYISRSKAIRRR